jgi:hypothetical protein
MTKSLSILVAALVLAGCARLPVSQVRAPLSRGIATKALPLGSASGIRGTSAKLANALVAAKDRNRDGQLTPDEFKGFTMSDVAINLTFKNIDTNGDGVVANAEMLGAVQSPGFVRAFQSYYNKEFAGYDGNRNEQLDRAEYDLFKATPIGQYLTASSFYDADRNGDGQLNPSEFEDLAFDTYIDFVVVPFLQQRAQQGDMLFGYQPVVFL